MPETSLKRGSDTLKIDLTWAGISAFKVPDFCVYRTCTFLISDMLHISIKMYTNFNTYVLRNIYVSDSYVLRKRSD